MDRKLHIPSVKFLYFGFMIFLIIGSFFIKFSGFGGRMMSMLAITIAISFTPLMWLSYVYRSDPFLSPSSKNVLIAITFGALAGIPSIIFGSILSTVGTGVSTDLVNAAIIAPFVEEFFKPLCIIIISMWGFCKFKIRSEYEGLIYGVACGVGFAIIEDFLYLFNNGIEFLSGGPQIYGWLAAMTALLRGLSAIIHPIGSGLIVYAFARYRTRQKSSFLVLVGGYLFAVFIHASWNGVATLLQFDYNVFLVFLLPLIVICSILLLRHLLLISKSAALEPPSKKIDIKNKSFQTASSFKSQS